MESTDYANEAQGDSLTLCLAPHVHVRWGRVVNGKEHVRYVPIETVDFYER